MYIKPPKPLGGFVRLRGAEVYLCRKNLYKPIDLQRFAPY